MLGHSHPAVVEAVQEQMARGTHLRRLPRAGDRWGELVKAGAVGRAGALHASGTEATLMALRLARAYTGRPKILKFAGHFHGWHDYAVAGGDPPYDGPVVPGVPAGACDR